MVAAAAAPAATTTAPAWGSSISSGAWNFGGTALGILGGAFGSGKGQNYGGNLDKEYRKYAKWATPVMKAKVNAAKAAGLHPLFALGASGAQSPGFSIQGQSGEGSFASKGLHQAAQGLMRQSRITEAKELVEAQAQASAMRVAEAALSNDTNQGVVDLVKTQRPVITRPYDSARPGGEGVIELTPAPQMTSKPGDPSTLAGTLQSRRTLQLPDGSSIFIPNVSELDSLMEEPLVAAGVVLAMNPDRSLAEITRAISGLEVKNKTSTKSLSGRHQYVKHDLWGLLKVMKEIPSTITGRYPK